MADYYLVRLARGPGWDHARRRRDQDGCDEHAAFMDALAEARFDGGRLVKAYAHRGPMGIEGAAVQSHRAARRPGFVLVIGS